MFAKALVNCKEPTMAKGIIYSKEPCKTLRNHVNGIYHPKRGLQGGYHHDFRFPDKETKAQEGKWLPQVHKIVCAGVEIRSQVGLTLSPVCFP